MSRYNSALSYAWLRAGAFALALLALAAAPAGAMAASDPTDAQYSSSLNQIASGGGGGSASSAASSAGGLPFTGLDVVLLAAVAGGLLLAGLVLRRQRPTT